MATLHILEPPSRLNPNAAGPTIPDGLLEVGDLVRMFEESEESTYTARKDAERDRDYVDNKQLTDAELATLNKRGQPPMIDNRIKSKVDYLVGMEKQQRIDPRAFPRTPKHEQDAQGATQALKYVADEQQHDNKRSGVWRNLLTEGAGGMGVAVDGVNQYGQPKIVLRRIAWDRMFWDPHSSEPDFSDAGYLGVVIWMDVEDAKRMYSSEDSEPGALEALETTLSTAPSDTYDDKPKFSLWADKKRKRVRVCQIWIKRDDEWYFAEFTKGGILKAGPSPYVDDQGKSDCELIFQSAYVDRDNNRYGLVREMITLQDGINKRHSKLLHQMNTRQVWIEEDAVPPDGIQTFREQVIKPDGTVMLAPGGISNQKVKIETHADQAAGQFQLLQLAMNAIDLKGPNATQMGDKTQGSSAASGRAIIASQQGGQVSLGDLTDNLRHLDVRVFRAIWARIRQFWTAPDWIRVTDDERNVKWVGMNQDPAEVEMMAQQNPEMADKIAGVVGNVAELDCDIIIDQAPDSIMPALESFEALANLKQYDTNNELPFRAIVVAHPNLKDRERLLAEMDKAAQAQQSPEAQEAKQIQKAGAVATVKKTESEALLNMARARAEMTPEAPDMMAPEAPEFEVPPQLQVAREVAEIDLTRAKTDQTRTQTMLAPAKMRQDAAMKQQALQQRAEQAKQMAKRPRPGGAG